VLPVGVTIAEDAHWVHLRRVVVASTVGTTIEWYDFLIYSTMTGPVFGKVFFSGSDLPIDTLKAFGVFLSALSRARSVPRSQRAIPPAPSTAAGSRGPHDPSFAPSCLPRRLPLRAAAGRKANVSRDIARLRAPHPGSRDLC